MSHRIEDECTCCALCVETCPERCIHEGEFVFFIDPEACTDCGDCVRACPVDCILGAAVPGAAPKA
ncbi:MAG TPA: 4Fe-4S binding protein [Planctomycetota bacterium]|nr:4Fe-4S binding protein [Planctomycetota bacterium]